MINIVLKQSSWIINYFKNLSKIVNKVTINFNSKKSIIISYLSKNNNLFIYTQINNFAYWNCIDSLTTSINTVNFLEILNQYTNIDTLEIYIPSKVSRFMDITINNIKHSLSMNMESYINEWNTCNVNFQAHYELKTNNFFDSLKIMKDQYLSSFFGEDIKIQFNCSDLYLKMRHQNAITDKLDVFKKVNTYGFPNFEFITDVYSVSDLLYLVDLGSSVSNLFNIYFDKNYPLTMKFENDNICTFIIYSNNSDIQEKFNILVKRCNCQAILCEDVWNNKKSVIIANNNIKKVIKDKLTKEFSGINIIEIDNTPDSIFEDNYEKDKFLDKIKNDGYMNNCLYIIKHKNEIYEVFAKKIDEKKNGWSWFTLNKSEEIFLYRIKKYEYVDMEDEDI